MVAPALIGAGISAIGGIFGGKKRDKAASAMIREQDDLQNEVRVNADAGMVALTQDQARALRYRAEDEARLKAATGFDLVKLVADADKAGFNPLTVLNATGGAGYDGRGAVLTSPFIGRAQGFFDKAAMIGSMSGSAAQAGQAKVETAGYFGDALAGLGNAFMDISNQQAQRGHEMAMLRTEIAANAPKASGRGSGATFAPVRTITASPVGSNMIGPKPLVKVKTPTGWDSLDPGVAERAGIKEGDTLIAEDYESILGDVWSEVTGTGNVILGKGPFYGNTSAVRPVVGPIGSMPQAPIWPPTNVQKARNPRGAGG